MSQENKSLKPPISSVKTKTFFLLVFCLSLLALAFSSPQEHDPIKHEVAVTRLIIPVFAFDTSGNPVYDLKQDDIKLYINGKPVEISSFSRINFQYDEEKTKKEKKPKIEQEQPVVQERIIFFIFDSMFNSFYGLKNGKKIVEKLVDKDGQQSQFVIMENSLFGGLKLVGGPETDKIKVKKLIKAVARVPEFSAVQSDYDITSRSPLSYNSTNKIIRREHRKFEKEKVKIFVEFLSRLKYSLEAIDQPKVIFLISEGFPQILFYEANLNIQGHVSYDPTPFRMMKQLVKEINDGGSLMYTIYPGRVNLQKRPPHSSAPAKGAGGITPTFGFTLDDAFIPITRDSGIESLKTMGVGSGGQFFEGSAERIIKEVHKSTAAYYELAFTPRSDLGDNMRIKIKCQRKGVRVDSLVQTVRNKAYADMKRIQKKIFAINLVMGRNWTSMEEKIKKGNYTWQNNQRTAIEVKIPENMKLHPVDIFIIQFEEDFKNPDIKMARKMVTETEIIEIKKKENKEAVYFLIIEPESTSCIYNRISQI
jgi:VWFA-related protein